MNTLQALLNDRMERSSQIEAVTGGGVSYTFEEYAKRIDQLAHYLHRKGIRKGDRVCFICQNNHHYSTIMLAAIKAGAVAVPLSLQLTSFELEGILKKAEPKALFFDREFRDTLAAVNVSLEDCLMIESGANAKTTQLFEDILASNDGGVLAEEVDESDLAMILFTSGTTGNPKGCMVGHGRLYQFLTRHDRQSFDLKGKRYLASHPLYHMSSINHLIASALEGYTLVFLNDATPKRILETIEKEHITFMMAFPSAYTYMLEEMKRGSYDLSSFEFAISGGTKVPVRLIKEYRKAGIQMMHGYGSTEAWVVSAWYPPMGEDKMGSAGKVDPDVEVKIVDPETHQPLPTGEIGEVVMRSPFYFLGYYMQPEATEKVLKDGWFHMGDAGYIDEDGFLYITGRYKDVILYGGDNIYPDQVEEVIDQIPGVIESAVIGLPDELYGEVPSAYIVKDDSVDLCEQDIENYCRKRLADYKVPSIHFTKDLPKNKLGKTMKNKLRELVVNA
ncbi:class I adenylate-forming enzyme family protein [Bacillus sp. 179-C3.3 HS]|uniref:class I adenylate-forming enzyme family protein n=1 Tax=Bacillus sp. 179-C3.3 HS TaxID=3232162 RepID=UPI0039A3F320